MPDHEIRTAVAIDVDEPGARAVSPGPSRCRREVTSAVADAEPVSSAVALDDQIGLAVAGDIAGNPDDVTSGRGDDRREIPAVAIAERTEKTCWT